MSRTDKTKQKLIDALDRIVRGRPARTDGKLTPSNLAREAAIGRATLYRFPDVLAEIERVQNRTAETAPTNLMEKVRHLEKEVEALSREGNTKARQYKEVAERCAQHIQVLTLALRNRDVALAERDQVIAELRAKIEADANVIPIGSRRHPGGGAPLPR